MCSVNSYGDNFLWHYTHSSGKSNYSLTDDSKKNQNKQCKVFTFVKRLMRKGPRCQEPSTGILIMKQIKRPGTVKLIYFMVWKCFPGNKQHTKSWRCTRNADKHSARIHRDHRGEKITKHRKHTGCISQISLWGIFLIVIISHYDAWSVFHVLRQGLLSILQSLPECSFPCTVIAQI